METSETINLLKNKIIKIFGFLILIRLGLYIPVPNVDLDIFSQSQSTNSLFSFAKNLTGSSFLSVGALGILPYINASIIIQLLVPIFPALERLQKEEGELGRKQIKNYTRYLSFGWAVVLSAGVAFVLIKPVAFNWNLLLALKVIVSLTTGSMLSMWFAELITQENLGNGSSMIIFINIIGGLPASVNEFLTNANKSSLLTSFSIFFKAYFVYLLIVALIVLVQGSYKKVTIVSARQLGFNAVQENSDRSTIKNSYIPVKLNQGGIMPLVFSTTIATFLFYPLQIASTAIFSVFNIDLGSTSFLTLTSLVLNIILVVFFSTFYALLVLKPKDLSDNLSKMAYNIPGFKQGSETTQYLAQVISRLSFMGGVFLAFLAFVPFLLGNFFQVTFFKNLTSLIILIGVITDVTSQVKGFLVSKNYESFKKA